MPPADRLLDDLGDGCDFATPERSFSPCFSNCGLAFDGEGGIAAVHVHYNRRTRQLGAPRFLALPGPVQERRQQALLVRQRFAWGGAAIAFWDRDAWVVELSGLDQVAFAPVDRTLREARVLAVGDVLVGCGFQANPDPRDPDSDVPVAMAVRALIGSLRDDGDGGVTASARAGRLVLAFAFAVLDAEPEAVAARLGAAPESAAAAAERATAWFRDTVGPLVVRAEDARERQVLALAVYSLACNATAAPGLLAGGIAVFPNRGAYPTHFLWDSCFQNLALELMHPRLAVDSLLLLTGNLRCDGKMAHFLCSTWMRPHASQPPLVGWAALRLVSARGDLALARRLLPGLIANNAWWLAQRMTRTGLISCPDPLETGWDDTPRLDRGPILALDMNSHLLLQLRATAALARLVGDSAAAQRAQAQADALAATLVERCYDPAANRFHDVLIATGERLAIRTPANFLPLLAGVPIADERARAMIRSELLDPARFCGAVPFPCVAYDEPTYQHAKWWRGPTWPSVAWLLLEVLDRFGFQAERRAIARRFYDVIIADGDLRELFDSQSGAGLGAHQQGWTAAIALRLHHDLSAATAAG